MKNRYREVRAFSVQLISNLKPEDFVLQPVEFVSPVKWHLAHTTWFFENFILKPHLTGYSEFDTEFGFLFNSYYESEGERTIRNERGMLSRPTVDEVLAYRQHVDNAMAEFISDEVSTELHALIELGINHEQQHQELITTDLKYSLSLNPLNIAAINLNEYEPESHPESTITIPKGIYEIGFNGSGFSFDNESGRHKVYLEDFEIQSRLITNGQWMDFIENGGYKNPLLWHAEGWDWVKTNRIVAPLYWEKNSAGQWSYYTLNGRERVDIAAPVSHISFYEAFAFAEMAGKRLPTEAEWEVASTRLNWGKRWEWTNSAYLPYPRYEKPGGAIGEYNGKFMVSQHVLRGASIATPKGHSRITYRNFFHPQLRWQFTGLRLVQV